jgi:hypothetical protein
MLIGQCNNGVCYIIDIGELVLCRYLVVRNVGMRANAKQKDTRHLA